MNEVFDGARLHRAVGELRAAVAANALPFETADVAKQRREQGELVSQLDDYILPRLESLDAPLLAVIGGSTGAGKSTLVNSIVREQVTRSGVLRPTTRASVLIHHPSDAQWFTGERVLPGLSRITGAATQGDDPSSLRLVASASVPRGLALLDAPDIDSVVSANRDLARQLLSAADLWLFVTTAVRYADAVPWEMLEQAIDRGTSVAVVLDRVPRDAMEEVRADLARMLAAQGLGQSPVFAVAESPLEENGMLPHIEVERISSWLHSLANDALSRQVVIRRTLDGALDSLDGRARGAVAAGRAQHEAATTLAGAASEAYSEQLRAVEEGLKDGTLLRGEVLARWQELVGTGELLKQFEAGVSKLRDRVTGFFRARTETAAPARDLGEALQSGVAQLVTSHGESAALDAGRAWRLDPAGKPIMARHPELNAASPELTSTVERLVRDWQGDVLDLVREEAGDKRTTARFLAFGVNGIAVMLMLITFASTYGLSGAEVGIAGGSAVLAQRLLEAIFGDQAVRTLANRARGMLLERITELFEREEQRYDAALAEVALAPGAAERIEKALAAVKDAR
ncbi:ABC transporter [Dermacoccus sp. 147Ba]|uniref:dynamin family protein n=1 Tax=Dermacoccus sp. 147Ba TaxID=2510111 RepID=UPI00101BC85E|nr:dynamin family protein [Dermacoccus sp. 147Ba]RYI24372.1 ABC transporter [Dermacoccus sp. 147Ba]